MPSVSAMEVEVHIGTRNFQKAKASGLIEGLDLGGMAGSSHVIGWWDVHVYHGIVTLNACAVARTMSRDM